MHFLTEISPWAVAAVLLLEHTYQVLATEAARHN